jgi:D-alanyl-D-alanine carboxypeptidase
MVIEGGRPDGEAPRSGYRRTDMQSPADPPVEPAALPQGAGGAQDAPGAALGPSARPGSRIRRTPRPRVAGAVLAAFVGIALLTAGLVQTAGGLAGAVGTGSPSPSGALSAVGSGGIASPAARSAPPGSPATSTPGPSAAPSGGPTAGGPTADEVQVAELHARLQAALDAVRAKLAIPGASVTILFPDGSSWTGVSGLAEIATRTPVGPTTAFAFASMSKTFTSALIIQLIEAGRLHLTDSAASILPKVATQIDPRITIAMLLDHTSGLQDYFLNPKIDAPLQAKPTRPWTTDQALAYVLKPYFPPGRGWHYSNTNYLLLGLIAERITGQPLDVAIRSRLLDPSGLKAIWYQAKEQPRAPLAHGYRVTSTKPTAKPIDLADGTGVAPFRSVVTAAAGAGSLAGTSEDLARWARLLYSGQVLGPDGTAVLLGGFSATAAYKPAIPYGYGVQAAVIDGHPSLGHSGRLLGFRGVLRHFPLEGLTIAVLTNQSRADPTAILRSLLAIALPPPSRACQVCMYPR